MATRYELNAVISGDNRASQAFTAASNDVRKFSQALRDVPNEISVSIDLENVGNDITELNRRLESGVNDVKVGIDFESLTNDLAAMNTRIAAGIRDVTVNIDYDRNSLSQLTRGAGVAAESLENLEQNTIDVGQAAIRSANVIRSSGFLVLLGGVGAAAYAAGPALQGVVGGTVALASTGASAATGVGLLVGAIIPSIRRFADYKESVEKAQTALDSAEKGTKEYREAQEQMAEAQAILTRREKQLQDEWGRTAAALSNDKGFKAANNNLLELADSGLELIRRVMPRLGEEAEETAAAFRNAADDIAEQWGSRERSSVARVLDNASDVTAGLTRGLGFLGEGLMNVVGSPAATRAARDLSNTFSDWGASFRDWSRTERAREGIADWIERGKTIWKGGADAFGSLTNALGKFDDRDAENIADGLRAIGRGAEFMIDSFRFVGREASDAFRWMDEAWKKVDKLDGEMKDVGKKGGSADNFWDAVGRGLRSGSAPGWQFDDWLKNMDNKRLPGYSKALDENRKHTNDWRNSQDRATKDSESWWEKRIYDPTGVVGYIGKLDDKLDSDRKKTNEWRDAHGKATSETRDFWDRRIYDPLGVTGMIGALDDKLNDNQKETNAWKNTQSNATEEAERTWQQAVLDGIVSNTLSRLTGGLASSADDTREWVSTVIDVLNSILDFLGIPHGDKPDKAVNPPSQQARQNRGPGSGGPDYGQSPNDVKGRVGLQYAGGIYSGDVRMMASGGFVDSDGIYTALTTGMDRALSQGAVWQAATGGISDGVVPRVVYGEGRPGSGPKREGYIPEDMEPRAAIGVLSEVASWFNMGVTPMMAAGGMLPPRGQSGTHVGADRILDYTATGGAAELARLGAAMWRGLVQPGGSEANVAIRDLPGALRGLTYSSGQIYLDPAAKAVAAAHEFGHRLGLGHGGHSIMGGAGYVTQEDFAALEQYYGIRAGSGAGGGVGRGGSGGGAGGPSWAPGGGGNVNVTNIHMTGGGSQSVSTSSSQGSGEMPHGAHAPDYPSMLRWMFRNPNAGMSKRMVPFPRFMQSGGTYTVTSGNLYPEAWSVASDIASAFNYLNEPGTTYGGHGADGDPMNSIDFQVSPWGTVADGAQFQTGEGIKNRLQSTHANKMDYIIWNKQANYGRGWETYTGGGGYAPPSEPSGYHQDHVHGEVLSGPGSGISGTGGGGGGFDAMGYIENQLKKIPAPNVGDGPFYNSFEEGARDWAVAKSMDFLRKQVGSMGLSPGSSGSGGSLYEYARQGLLYGNVFPANDSNIQKIIVLANKESGGDPNAVNESSGAAGLMQMMPETFNAYRVDDRDSIWNGTHNVAASSRYQKDRYGNLVTFSPYTAGGFALQPQFATVAEHGPEFFMPLHDPEAARRFMDFLDRAAKERLDRGTVGAPLSPHRYDSVAPGAYASDRRIVDRLERIEAGLKEVSLTPETQAGVGEAAATGTIERGRTSTEAQRKIAEGQERYKNRTNDLLGRRRRT